ncbi:MAG TPA: catalase family protein [Candidatus Acidoferrum sp.]|jgi:catalase|nr:catalase family protein [Candidatus Acidoferrum sp.]
MNGRRVRAVVGFLVILALGYYLFRPGPRGPMGEYSSAEEQYLTSQIVASALQMVDMSRQHMVSHPLPGYPPKVAASGAAQGGNAAASNSSQPYMRDVHSKTHGLVKAKFTVLDNLDPRIRYGIFANPKQYQAWIRFSSGNEYPQPDSTPDARGMAIKIMGVEGKKLLEEDGLPPASTQDFALMNATQFFIRDIEEYNQFTKYLGSGFGVRARYGYFFGGSINPGKWHLHEMMLAKATLKKAPHSLLNTKFYSVSAYKLGSQENVKYSARPCSKARAADVDRSEPNFLREEMQKRLASGTACFDFMVQLQVPGKNMPVEDTTVEWSENDSPFIPVARIEILKQQFEANNDVGENMSFNPWHSLPEHKPIGVMNRIRKAVYLGVSRYRRDMNGVALCEPVDWDHPIDPASCEVAPTPAKPTQTAETVAEPTASK